MGNELRDVLLSLGQEPTDQELEILINAVDADGNGTVEFSEFRTLMARMMKDNDTEEELVEAFKVFDRDDNGKITHDELKHVMQNLDSNITEEQINLLIEEADT